MNATRRGDLSHDPLPRVESLRPDPRSPAWVWVIVGSRRVARVPASALATLELREGTPWTPGLADRIETASQVQKARERGVRLLAVRARTRVELVRKLVSGGTVQVIAEAAAESLVRDGLLNDTSLAADVARKTGTRTASNAALEVKLSTRGVNDEDRVKAIEGAAPESERALDAAKSFAKRLTPGLTPEVKWRRLMSSLARRGFDEETSLDAARSVLGPPPGDQG